MLCGTGRLNLSDLPEMMPGARPRATPARRREFEQQSLWVHEEDTEQRWDSEPTEIGNECADLEGMFPTLDPSLVRTLRAEAASLQQAIDTLLSLVSPAAQDAVTLPMKPSVQDHGEFPLLTSSDGWQVLPARLDLDEDSIGTGWRDLAKSIAERPAPPKCSPPARVPKPKKVKNKSDEEPLASALLPTEYDYRHTAGERRVSKKKLHGRGSSQKATTRAELHGEPGETDEALSLQDI